MKAVDVFRPEAAQAMSRAFDDVCECLQILGSAVKTRELIAKRIIELGRQGEHQYERLRHRVLHEADCRIDLRAPEGASNERLARQRPRPGRGACRAPELYPQGEPAPDG